MADIELEEELTSEFGEFSIDVEGKIGILEKLTRLCKTYSLTVTDIVAQWCSFGLNSTGNTDISEEALDNFEKKHLLKQEKRNQPGSRNNNITTPHIKTYSGVNSLFEDDDNDMLGGYAKTPETKESIKRLHTTPEHSLNKRFASVNSTPISQRFSPASMATPALSTPSAKYEGRTCKGDVTISYGIKETDSIEWKGSNKKIQIRQYEENGALKKTYKHMFQKLQDKADVLNDTIENLMHEMKENLMLDDFQSVGQQTQDETLFAGRVCCDTVGRLNSKSIVLEGSRDHSGGRRIPLDVSDVNNYSLFPGQIVVVQGTNPTGNSIKASAIYKGSRLPFYSARKKNQTVNEDHFTTQIACGPFATCDESLSFKPLDDLLDIVRKEKPDVLILLGPFVDSKQPLIEQADIEERFEDLFSMCIQRVQNTVDSIHTEVIMVPSQRDVFHEYVYPQPPFESINSDKIHMMSDPCTVLINDVCFGLTSTDVLFHLGAEEVAKFANKSDRLGRLADHLLLQQSYYPLHPTHEEVNLDYEHFEAFGYLQITPDVLIVPSDLRYFVKNVEGCLCMNPGRVVKGTTGGTFIKFLVKPRKPENTNKSSVVDQSIAQVVRI